MGKYIDTREISLFATADLTGKLGYAMALDTANANSVIIANAQTTKTIGILLSEGKAGDAVNVLLAQYGTARAIYGGTVAIGDRLTPDASGRLITTVTAGDQVIATAKEAGAINEYHEVILDKFKV